MQKSKSFKKNLLYEIKLKYIPFSLQEDKLDLSNLTCLYIEDQIDSQILFRVQMRGLKDIKYAASFEDSLPMLESENFGLYCDVI